MDDAKAKMNALREAPYFSGRIVGAARAVYSGWRGWHHSWHWPKAPRAAVAVIAEQAAAEAVRMRAEIRSLKERAVACEELADIARNYMADDEAPDA